MELPGAKPAVAERSVSHGAIAAGMPVTLGIIAVNAAVFLAMVFRHVSLTSPTTAQLWQWGANHGPLTFDGQWWRLVSNTFVHIGLVHLVVNMWSLWNLGALAERLYGRWLYLFLYLFCGAAGSMASLAWHPMVTSAGASGAIFGLAGALIVTFRWGDLPIPRHVLRPILLTLVLFTVANVLFGLWTQFVDNGAHLGGLAAGMALAWVVIQPSMRGEGAQKSRLYLAACSLLILAGLWGFVVRAGDWTVHFERGEAARRQNKLDVAINELKLATARKPNTPELQLLLARTYLQAGQFGPAKARLLRAVELDRKSSEAWSELGVLYLAQNQAAEAYNAFSREAALQPNSAQAQSQMALAALAMACSQEAITLYKHAIALKPDFADAYKNLGIIYLRLRDNDNALAIFQQMAKVAPNSFEAQIGLATAYQAKGMQAEASTAIAKAMKLRPPPPVPPATPPGPAGQPK